MSWPWRLAEERDLSFLLSSGLLSTLSLWLHLLPLSSAL